MIFRWVNHPALNRVEQLANIIFDFGMCTKEQILAVTGWKKSYLDDIFKRLRNQHDDPSEWLKVNYLPPIIKKQKRAVYSLGRTAIEHIHHTRNITSRIKESPVGQLHHFVGTNDILVRAIDVLGRDRVDWYSTNETTDLLYLELNEAAATDKERRDMIRPDAKLILDKEKEFFIEFDNDTEGPRQLEKKFHRYIEVYQKLGLNIPIVWVTISLKRKIYLEKNWRGTLAIAYKGLGNPPPSFFAISGEETEIYYTYVKKNN